jgi:hypothetical protein
MECSCLTVLAVVIFAVGVQCSIIGLVSAFIWINDTVRDWLTDRWAERRCRHPYRLR